RLVSDSPPAAPDRGDVRMGGRSRRSTRSGSDEAATARNTGTSRTRTTSRTGAAGASTSRPTQPPTATRYSTPQRLAHDNRPPPAHASSSHSGTRHSSRQTAGVQRSSGPGPSSPTASATKPAVLEY